MNNMELDFLDSRKKEHAAITVAMSDFERIGYLVSGICFKNGSLEVTCRPPGRATLVDLSDSPDKSGKDDPGLSMDGVSESFNTKTRAAKTPFRGFKKLLN
jgi:hypothetical protein